MKLGPRKKYKSQNETKNKTIRNGIKNKMIK